MSDQSLPVTVCIVTHDSAADLPDCLESLIRFEHRPLSVVLVDCASRDESVRLARAWNAEEIELRVLELDRNVGFSGGMNVAISQTDAPYLLALNPDARPAPDFLSRLLTRLQAESQIRVGAVTGRLLRPLEAGSRTIDSCGIYLTPTWRHLDRGSGDLERGQWSQPERVFGATAAASLYSREALDDTALEGQYFAEEFHTYREDAELCFRLRERRWEILYEPTAICEHRRTNLPHRRRQMTDEINFHSLKNRYLLRLYHQYPLNLFLTLLPTLWRDLLALAYVLLRERSSLTAYAWLWRQRETILRRRRLLASRRLSTDLEINRWFFRRSRPL